MTVWDHLVGQPDVAERLARTARGAAGVVRGDAQPGSSQAQGMTHAWLFTGPPGSGRSNAARAFAAALQCDEAGCGECAACRTSLSGSHADVTLVDTESAVIRVDHIRHVVRSASLSPAGGRWQVIVVSDADRLTDQAADALLKSIEEPPPRTVWLLCAPTVEDVVPTIRSRCRVEVLRTPSTEAVAGFLVERDGVDEALATYCAQAAQGHIGRARALARQDESRNRRKEIVDLPSALVDLGSCLTAAANLVAASEEEARTRVRDLDARELGALEEAYGAGSKGVRTTGLAAARKELERDQKQRAKRIVRDSLDLALLDLASYYRDVVSMQLGTGSPLVNADRRAEIERAARQGTGDDTMGRLDAIFAAREALTGEVAPLLAMESLMIKLGRGAR